MFERIILDSTSDLVEIASIGVLTYILFVVMLRMGGKRTLAKMNIFDFVVTIAVGSLLASTIIVKEVTLVEGVLAASVLVGLQYLVTWTSVRWDAFNGIIKSDPTMVYYNGSFLTDAMQRVRITHDEVLSRIRKSTVADVSTIYAVVLETDGSLSVLQYPANEAEVEELSIADVDNHPDDPHKDLTT